MAHIKFLTTIICHVCGAMPLTSFGNSLQKKEKKVILALESISQWCNASLINHSTNLWNFLIEVDSFWEAASPESFGINLMIWFSMLVNGLSKRRTKWCGTPCLTMKDWSGNKLSMTWKKLLMLPKGMFTTKLT